MLLAPHFSTHVLLASHAPQKRSASAKLGHWAYK